MSNDSNKFEDEQRARDQEAQEEQGFVVNDRRFWQLDEEELSKEDQGPSQPSYISELEQQLADKEKQLKEYIAAYKEKVVGGVEETKERLARDAEQKAKALKGEIAEPMMEVLETFERVLQTVSQSQDPQALIQGLQMVHSLMMSKLTALGLDRIDTVGNDFDPTVHEAIGVVPVNDPAHNNVVVAEVSAGFVLEGRVVRAAKVQVGKLAN